jgi:hypothetical protein
MGAVDYLHDIPEKGDPDEDDPFFWISEMKHAGSGRSTDSALRQYDGWPCAACKK